MAARCRSVLAALAVVTALGLASCTPSSGRGPASSGTEPGTATSTAASTAATASSSQAGPSTAAPVPTGGEVVTPAGVVLPNPRRTPGATNPAVTQASIHTTICVSGWSATVRPPSSYTTGLKKQQLATGYTYHGDPNPSDYEEDHLISLELGGSPTSPLNLWPEPYAGPDGARIKDEVENTLHSLVCAGRLGLPAAQHAIAADWYQAYVTYVGTAGTPTTTHAAAPPAVAHTSAPPPASPLSCSASMSNASPAQYSTTHVLVHTAAGAAVTATAHYKTTDTSHSTTAAGDGVADISFAISRATIGYRVAVDVTVSAHGGSAACHTAFTPQ